MDPYGQPPPDLVGAGDDEESANVARMKMYVKSKIPTRQEILDRRSRKNTQSRSRAAKLRDRVSEIKDKPLEERTEEELHMIDLFENRRQRKNDRSRERAIEKKMEIDRILNKPERKRTKLEKQFLETALSAKQRKNEGDRLRRQRIKVMGLKGPVHGISARPPGSAEAVADAHAKSVALDRYAQEDAAAGMTPLPSYPHHQGGPNNSYPPFSPAGKGGAGHFAQSGGGQYDDAPSDGVERNQHADGNMGTIAEQPAAEEQPPPNSPYGGPPTEEV